MLADLRRILIGAPLPSARMADERLSKVRALAVFSSDALSSVAYATEEMLLVLVLAGTGALGLSLPISLVIAGLLVIVAASYYQTIHGYPSGGGAYIVAHDNLGVWPGLTAAAALLTDYVLTVAVSTTAGIAAVTSAFPALLPYRVELCLLAIVLIAWANLRGVRESGTLFAIPTYGFVLIFLALLTAGLVRWATGTLSPVDAPAVASPAAQPDGAHDQAGVAVPAGAFGQGSRHHRRSVSPAPVALPVRWTPSTGRSGKRIARPRALTCLGRA